MEKKPTSFVTEVDVKLAEKMLTDLKDQGFEICKPPPHSIFSAKKPGISCTLYNSGKLVVQGANSASFIEFYLEPEILKNFSFTHQEVGIDLTARIGSDEAGKGDFFGPLCIATVYAAGDDITMLKSMGVRDSKSLSDQKIGEIAKKIRQNYPHHIVKINPAKYNELYQQFKNLNRLLAWAHATAIEQIVEQTGCHTVIIDQFAAEGVMNIAMQRKNSTLKLIQRTHAEADLVVAAASIMARHTFLDGIDKLGQEFDMKLPKGASAQVIAAGKQFVQRYGEEALPKVAKMHFKTTNTVLGNEE